MHVPARERAAASALPLRSVDQLILGWLAVATAAVLALRNFPEWAQVVAMNFTLMAAALALNLWHGWRRSPASRFLRETYPLLFILPLYEGVGHMVHLVHRGVFDAAIVALEQRALGDVWVFVQRIESRPLTEVMHVFYFGYYFILVLPALWLFLQGDLAGFRRMTTTVMTAFVPCFVIFVLVPVEGPRFYLAARFPEPQQGLWITAWVQGVVERGGFQGAALPSSHVAAAVAALGAGWSADRRLGLLLLPMVLGLSLATVYGRYHYPTDVVLGAIIGAAALVAGPRLCAADERAA